MSPHFLFVYTVFITFETYIFESMYTGQCITISIIVTIKNTKYKYPNLYLIKLKTINKLFIQIVRV